MHPDLPRSILQRAYELDGATLDHLAAGYGAGNWAELTGSLSFEGMGIGGGGMALVAQTSAGPWVSLTDGETDVPDSDIDFCLIIEPELFAGEDYALFVNAGQVTGRMGTQAGR
ncbi:hypothetical protein GO986_12580 [Deinococcus sp. HMF7620]|uniref:Uncharacterized protein n=1 Tax=Deinococcus arboris TaxID=2682977 RepID=A0A7C9M2J6_9DEIO|nr:hypothetical protein [Deinococcus arboris]MVN87602.1 hypothetical protein [Deinococcus arboris]